MEITFNLPYKFTDGAKTVDCVDVLKAVLDKTYKYRFNTVPKILHQETLPLRQTKLTRIVVDLPHVFFAGAKAVDNAYVLRAMLDGLIDVNQAYLHRYHATPSLYDSGVVYGRTKDWDSIPALYARREGDCKSLTAAYVAERRVRGEWSLPRFRLNFLPGGILFHILAQQRKGWEDPSKRLGMIKHEAIYYVD